MLSVKRRVHFAASVRDNDADTLFKRRQAEQRVRKANIKRIRDVIYRGLNGITAGSLKRKLEAANITSSNVEELFNSKYSKKIFRSLMSAITSEFEDCIRNIIPVESLLDALSKDSYAMLEDFFKTHMRLAANVTCQRELHRRNMVSKLRTLIELCPIIMYEFIKRKNDLLAGFNDSQVEQKEMTEEGMILLTIEVGVRTVVSQVTGKNISFDDVMDCSSSTCSVGIKRLSEALIDDTNQRNNANKRQRLQAESGDFLPASNVAREAPAQTSSPSVMSLPRAGGHLYGWH